MGGVLRQSLGSLCWPGTAGSDCGSRPLFLGAAPAVSGPDMAEHAHQTGPLTIRARIFVHVPQAGTQPPDSLVSRWLRVGGARSCGAHCDSRQTCSG
eukprot:615327-Rhodomonas_salina.3